MKENLKSILEALFFPKPTDYLNRDNEGSFGNGLILIPIPERAEAGDFRNQNQ